MSCLVFGDEPEVCSMSEHMMDGLRIMVVGITGVFANLIIVMLMVKGMGRIFGKKPKAKKQS